MRTILVDCRKVRHAKNGITLLVCTRCGAHTMTCMPGFWGKRCALRKVRGPFARLARPCRGELVRVKAVDA